jgi:hypothetical protein
LLLFIAVFATINTHTAEVYIMKLPAFTELTKIQLNSLVNNQKLVAGSWLVHVTVDANGDIASLTPSLRWNDLGLNMMENDADRDFMLKAVGTNWSFDPELSFDKYSGFRGEEIRTGCEAVAKRKERARDIVKNIIDEIESEEGQEQERQEQAKTDATVEEHKSRLNALQI